jgi:hypothetical protein
VVGIATGYGLDDREVGVQVPVGSRIFSPPSRPDRLWGPPSLLSNGYPEDLSPVVKRQGREADHSPPTSAEVKKTSIHPLPTRLHGIVLNSLSTGATFQTSVSKLTWYQFSLGKGFSWTAVKW